MSLNASTRTLGASTRSLNTLSKPKPRLGVIIRQSFQESTTQSADLGRLKERYQKLCQMLEILGKALKLRHAALVNTVKARSAVIESLAVMSKFSPLNDTAQRQNFAMEAMTMMGKDRADEFQMFALDYFLLWQETVTTRINAEMKATDQLRRDADHYKTKVESLKQTVKKMRTNKKPIPQATMEKLGRNRDKSNNANKAYEDAEKKLSLLMEELVERSWRDLHPLFLKLVKFDDKVLSDEKGLVDDGKAAVQELRLIQKGDQHIPKSIAQNRFTQFELPEFGQLVPSPTTSNSSGGSSLKDNTKRPLTTAPLPAHKLKARGMKKQMSRRNSWFGRTQSKREVKEDNDVPLTPELIAALFAKKSAEIKTTYGEDVKGDNKQNNLTKTSHSRLEPTFEPENAWSSSSSDDDSNYGEEEEEGTSQENIPNNEVQDDKSNENESIEPEAEKKVVESSCSPEEKKVVESSCSPERKTGSSPDSTNPDSPSPSI